MHEHRYIRAQRKTQCRKILARPAQVPYLIERHQTGGRVRTAAAQASPHRYAFEHADVRPQGATGSGLQSSSCAHAKVGILGNAGNFSDATNPAIGTRLDRDLIAYID